MTETEEPILGIIITINNVNVLEMLDGSEFSIGRTISSEPKELIEKGTAMEGAVTDGCAVIVKDGGKRL